MDIRILTYFKTIVEEGSISRAASVLNMSQPPLSKQIKNLEDELQAELLIRDSKVVIPTETGKILYRHTIKILEMFEGLKHDIILMNKGELGCLRIGCIDSLEDFIVNTYLVKYLEQHDGVNFQFYTGDSDEIIDLINFGEVDVGVVRHPFDNDLFNSLPLIDDKFIVVVPDVICKKDGPILPSELFTYPILTHRRYQSIIKDYFEKNNRTFVPYCVSNDTSNMIKWSKSGLGVAIVPYYSCININDDLLHFREIASDVMKTKTSIVWKKDFQIPNIAKNFLKLIELNKLSNELGGQITN